MSLQARIVLQRPDFLVDVELDAVQGSVVGLVGPNGAGKTSVLRVLAGLEPGSAGTRVTVDDVAVERLPPHRRPITYVAADLMLFPHLDVLDNVAFGLRAQGIGRAAAADQARSVLDRLGAGQLAERRPSELSGGQAQRVALARALVLEPDVLLLDEPLAALDAATRIEVRSQLRSDLASFGGVTLLVTHDPVDALALADRLLVLESGRVVQDGEPRQVARHPRTPYVARLVGLNLLAGEATGRRVTLASGAELTVVAEASGRVLVAFRPGSVSVHRERPEGSPRNVFPGVVAGYEPQGEQVRLDISGVVPMLADVTVDGAAALDLAPGSQVWVSVKAVETSVYPG